MTCPFCYPRAGDSSCCARVSEGRGPEGAKRSREDRPGASQAVPEVRGAVAVAAAAVAAAAAVGADRTLPYAAAMPAAPTDHSYSAPLAEIGFRGSDPSEVREAIEAIEEDSDR